MNILLSQKIWNRYITQLLILRCKSHSVLNYQTLLRNVCISYLNSNTVEIESFIVFLYVTVIIYEVSKLLYWIPILRYCELTTWISRDNMYNAILVFLFIIGEFSNDDIIVWSQKEISYMYRFIHYNFSITGRVSVFTSGNV